MCKLFLFLINMSLLFFNLIHLKVGDWFESLVLWVSVKVWFLFELLCVPILWNGCDLSQFVSNIKNIQTRTISFLNPDEDFDRKKKKTFVWLQHLTFPEYPSSCSESSWTHHRHHRRRRPCQQPLWTIFLNHSDSSGRTGREEDSSFWILMEYHPRHRHRCRLSLFCCLWNLVYRGLSSLSFLLPLKVKKIVVDTMLFLNPHRHYPHPHSPILHRRPPSSPRKGAFRNRQNKKEARHWI